MRKDSGGTYGCQDEHCVTTPRPCGNCYMYWKDAGDHADGQALSRSTATSRCLRGENVGPSIPMMSRPRQGGEPRHARALRETGQNMTVHHLDNSMGVPEVVRKKIQHDLEHERRRANGFQQETQRYVEILEVASEKAFEMDGHRREMEEQLQGLNDFVSRLVKQAEDFQRTIHQLKNETTVLKASNQSLSRKHVLAMANVRRLTAEKRAMERERRAAVKDNVQHPGPADGTIRPTASSRTAPGRQLDRAAGPEEVQKYLRCLFNGQGIWRYLFVASFSSVLNRRVPRSYTAVVGTSTCFILSNYCL